MGKDIPLYDFSVLDLIEHSKALDYESRDSRFDPWHGHTTFHFLFIFSLV